MLRLNDMRFGSNLLDDSIYSGYIELINNCELSASNVKILRDKRFLILSIMYQNYEVIEQYTLELTVDDNKHDAHNRAWQQFYDINSPMYFERLSKILLRIEHRLHRLNALGGNNKYKYKGKKYKIHFGLRGGKYIVVGKDKEKIYI